MDGDEGGGGGATLGELFKNQRRIQPAQSHAPVLFIAVQGTEPQRAGFTNGVFGEEAFGIPFCGKRRQCFFRKLSSRFAESDLFFCERKVHDALSPLS